MGEYKWQGSGQHGGFVRQGNRRRAAPADSKRDQALYAQMAGVSFYDPACGASHPLAEHRDCRNRETSHEHCEFAAGSLYCVRDNCPNPKHRSRPCEEPATAAPASPADRKSKRGPRSRSQATGHTGGT